MHANLKTSSDDKTPPGHLGHMVPLGVSPFASCLSHLMLNQYGEVVTVYIGYKQ